MVYMKKKVLKRGTEQLSSSLLHGARNPGSFHSNLRLSRSQTRRRSGLCVHATSAQDAVSLPCLAANLIQVA